MKAKFSELMNAVVNKLIDMVIAKVNSGSLDVFLQARIDAIVLEITAPTP